MRHLKPALLALSGAALLSGCGSAGPPPPTDSASLLRLTRAADISGQTSGFRTAFALRETSPALPATITATGQGSFNDAAHAGRLAFDMNLPNVPRSDAKLHLSMVIRSGTIYLGVPAQLAARLGGARWLEINLTQLGRAEGLPGLGSLANGSSSMTDPGQYLEYLRAAAGGSVADLGGATVDGVPTEHFHARINPAKLASAVNPARRQAVEQLLAALQRKGSGLPAAMPLDAWIDRSQRVRRIVLQYTVRVPGQAVSLTQHLQMDFTSYGPQPVPAPPPASQTRNLLSLMRSAASGQSGSTSG